jgi:hypothetical protein
MRKVSTLVGLTLVTVAAMARAENVAPTATTASAPTATAAPPAAVVVAAPAPAPAPVAAQPAPAHRKIQLGLSLLPMALGNITASAAGMSLTTDGAFAYGVGLSASYQLIAGLSVGLAPQVLFNVKPKESGAPAATQFDFMARVAYAVPIPDVVMLYAEVLPGYSFLSQGKGQGPASTGLVLVFGVGATVDLTDRVFANLGAGYQKGFQKQTSVADYKTDYVRVALGGGVRF